MKISKAKSKNSVRRFLFTATVLSIVVVSGLQWQTTTAQENPPYKNANLSIDERVKDLLGRMTLETKIRIKKPGRTIISATAIRSNSSDGKTIWSKRFWQPENRPSFS